MSQPSQCSEWEVMLQGFVDGELDAAHAMQFEQHLATCVNCAGRLERLRTVRRMVSQKEVRWRTPDHVRAQVLATIAEEAARSQDGNREWLSGMLRFIRHWTFVPAGAALAASLLLVFAPIQAPMRLENEILASHVRSLLVDHLTDVATSDQHTVKPWFNGKIDFSPPVVDLAARGFPLVGGRVDYVDGRIVAALVYRRQGHPINVFVWPAAPRAASTVTRDGYTMMSWSREGLTFWAISDASADDVSRFHEAFAEAAGK